MLIKNENMYAHLKNLPKLIRAFKRNVYLSDLKIPFLTSGDAMAVNEAPSILL